MIGNKIYNLAKKIWSYDRSLTGNGVRKTLKEFNKIFKGLKTFEIKSGTKAFDWIVPDEWNVNQAYILDPNKKRICDFKKNNLHLVSYSIPVRKSLKLNELKKKLYSDPNNKDAIPYRTSYYKRDWGFCITDNQKKNLKKGNYNVFIDSKIDKNGSMTFGEIFIKGKSSKEIFFSTYICHPSLANNELSGPCLLIYLAKEIAKKINNYSVRIVFIPETIGSIYYLSRNYKKMKKNIDFAFNITCVGDSRNYSFIPSRKNNTNTDSLTRHVYKFFAKNFKEYSWNDRGSDERNYCSPGIDLPMCTIMRSKFGDYKEYHTSNDNLTKVVNKNALGDSFSLIEKLHFTADNFCYPKASFLGEPFLSKRNLYPNIGAGKLPKKIMLIKNILTYSDGLNSIIDIANKCNVAVWEIIPTINEMKKKKLLNV